MRRVGRGVFVAWLCLLSAGCSGPYSIVPHNALGTPIQLTIRYLDTGNRIPEDRTETWQLSPGARGNSQLVWFGSPPPRLYVSIRTGSELRQVVIGPQKLRRLVGSGSSQGFPLHLWVTKGGVDLQGPDAWDRVEKSSPVLAGLVFIIAFVSLPFLLIAALARRLHR